MRNNKKHIILITFLIYIVCQVRETSAQVNCSNDVPYYNVNLTGNPSGLFTTPAVIRDGNCCGTTSPDRCIHFEITLDSNAVALSFQVTSGALPPGALFYQVNCGVQTQVGQYLCISGVGPHHLTFCKPGNNTNTYTVTSISKPLFPADDTVRVGCTKELVTQGMTSSSITWNSVYPGAPGAYNSLLSCTTGCSSASFSPTAGSPPYIDYVICGAPIASNCMGITQFCDTVRVYIYSQLQGTVNPNPSTYCIATGGTTLTATANGGLPPYSFKWKNPSGTVVGSSASCFANSAGNYTCEITDALSPECPASVITVPVSISNVSLTFSSTNINCNNQSTGSASVTATGGTLPYSYQWSQGSTTQLINNVSAGSYAVTITDAGGCVKTGNIIISEPPSVVSLSVTQTNVLCFSANTGSASVTATGGTGSYTYNWSNGNTQNNISNLSAGNYTVTVTDANSCSVSESIQILEPSSSVNAATEIVNVSCYNGTNGSALTTATGGTSPYIYQWNNGSSSAGISSLSAGSYTITVTDNNGCSTINTIAVTQPVSPVSVTIDISSNVSCFGASNGAGTATAAGGTSPYTYLWSNGSSSSSLTNAASGSYQVTVTDKNGCSEVQSTTISQPPAALSATTTTTEVQCFGDATGGATVNGNGGTAPYAYQWNTGSSATSINGLNAGNYSVTITDAKGCTTTRSVTVQQPVQALEVNGSITHVLCKSANTGSIIHNVSGGTSPYIYNWNNGESGSSILNLSAGTYTVTVSDAHSCTTVTNYTVTEPSQSLNINILSQNNVSCNSGNNGSLAILVTGGSPSYTYLWSNGSTSNTAQNLPAGNYTITVTDANSCTLQLSSITVSEPAAPLSATASVNHANCFNGTDGAITISPSNGTTPYSYLWSNGSTQQNISNLIAGNYSVTITDANGCTFGISEVITQPVSPLAISLSATDISCVGNTVGSINSTVTGGTPPYIYQWSNGSSQEDITNLSAAAYTVTITDANGCKLTDGTEVHQPPGALNVSSSITNVKCHGDASGSININASSGTPPYTYSWNDGSTTSSLNNLPAGSYTVTVTDNNNCKIINTLFVTQPQEPLILSGVSTAVDCYGNGTGSIDITATGGTAAYIYSWSNGSTLEDIQNVISGNYTVTVTDANNCAATGNYLISQPTAPLSASASVVNINCHDVNDGSIDITVSGGASVYNYQWSNGATSSGISNLATGNYSVTITDNNGCTLQQNYSIIYTTQPFNATASVTSVSCYSDSTGAIDMEVSGGSGQYTYQWNTGSTNQDLNNLSAAQYSVTIADENGCIHNEIFSILQPAAALQSTLIQQDELCFNDSTGVIDITPTGGTTPYSFNWSNGASTEDLNGVTAGSYQVIITDFNGCTIGLSQTVNGPGAMLNFTSTIQDVDCKSNTSGSIQLSVSGGTAPYIYNWSTGDSTSSINNLATGTYSFTVIDYNSCPIAGTLTVNEPVNALNCAAIITEIDCHGNNTGSANLLPSGGTGPYNIVWSNGATTMSLSELIAGSYTYTVTDNNNCNYSATIVVNEPQASLQVSSAHNDVLCFGNSSGDITASATGGTPVYTYLWSNGANTSSIQNLASGQYTVTVTDTKGCSSILTTTIQQPSSAINATATIINSACNSGNNGSITLNINGGTSPYQVNWNNGTTGLVNSQLPAASYTALITDNNGCTYTNIYTVSEPSLPLLMQPAITNVSCAGLNNGAIALTVSGGNPGYTYLWGNGNTSSSITGLAPGSYQITVTDAGGCSSNASLNITQPSSLTSSLSATNSNCLNGLAGNIVVHLAGGMQPYQYIWNTGATGSSLNNIYAGLYTVTVTDANGCSSTLTATLADQSSLTLNTNGPVEICVGTTTTLSATNIPGVQYQWLYNNIPLNGATTSSFTTPAPGSYILTATTACGTFTSNPVRVTTRSLTGVSISNNFIICPGEKVQLLAGGGLNYQWTPASGLSNANISNPVAAPKNTTEYTVTITDDFGCKATASVTVSVLCDTLDVPNGFSPNGDGTNDYFVIDGLSKYPDNTLFIYNRWGNLIYKMHEYDNTWNGTSNVSGIYMSKTLPNGTYYYLLDLQNDQKPLNGFLVLKR